MCSHISLWRRQWHPTPVLLPGKSHGGRSLVGCSPWGREESDITERLHFHFHELEKEMATHSSVLVWRIPGTGEPGGRPSMGSHRVGHDWSDLAYSDIVPLIYVNETICMVICPSTRFKSIILWPRMTRLVPRLSPNTSYGWGAWCHSEFLSIPFFH